MLTALVLLSVVSTQNPTCTDVYDATEGCKSPDNSLFITAGEPPARPDYDETPIEVPADDIAFQFAAVSAVPAAGALALHLTSAFYALHFAQVDAARIIPTDERRQYEFLQTGLLWGAIGMWLATGLVAGTGAAIWVFDPMTGRVRPSLKAD